MGIAFFGYFTCWQQRQMLKAGVFEADNEWGYDFSKGLNAFDDRSEHKPSRRARRRAAKQAQRAQRAEQRQAEKEKRIDEILAKVHDHGMDSLTPKELKMLRSATERKKHV